MIEEATFKRIEKEVIEAISSALDQIREKNEMGYILFLANAEYYDVIANSADNGISPFVIEDPMDRYYDETRIKFLVSLLNTFYTFDRDLSYYDNEQILHIEMMAYTHTWEAVLMLKKLYRIAHLLNGEGYKWTIEIPENSKYHFINDNIKEILKKDCPLYKIIDKGYSSTLRNSFAHSLYYFDSNDTIRFNHRKKKDYDLTSITINEWKEYFSYSALLSCHLYNIVDNKEEKHTK